MGKVLQDLDTVHHDSDSEQIVVIDGRERSVLLANFGDDEKLVAPGHVDCANWI